MDLESSRQGVKGSFSSILPSVRFSGSMNESRFPSSGVGETSLDKISSQISAQCSRLVF